MRELEDLRGRQFEWLFDQARFDRPPDGDCLITEGGWRVGRLAPKEDGCFVADLAGLDWRLESGRYPLRLSTTIAFGDATSPIARMQDRRKGAEAIVDGSFRYRLAWEGGKVRRYRWRNEAGKRVMDLAWSADFATQTDNRLPFDSSRFALPGGTPYLSPPIGNSLTEWLHRGRIHVRETCPAADAPILILLALRRLIFDGPFSFADAFGRSTAPSWNASGPLSDR